MLKILVLILVFTNDHISVLYFPDSLHSMSAGERIAEMERCWLIADEVKALNRMVASSGCYWSGTIERPPSVD